MGAARAGAACLVGRTFHAGSSRAAGRSLTRCATGGRNLDVCAPDEVAIWYAQHVASEDDDADPEAERALAAAWTPDEQAEIKAYITAIIFGNLTGNSADAWLARLHGVPVEGGHPAGEAIAALAGFPALLSSCVAFYTGRYLVRHGLDRAGLAVTAEFAMAAGRPARVGAVRLRITVPGGVPPQRTGALLAVASHCTVHNTLRQQRDVRVELAGAS